MTAVGSTPLLAVVIPVFNEQAVLPELFARLTAVFDAAPDCTWQALLVDDGSRDTSTALIGAQAARDPRFALLELSRNFGFQAALSAGLAHAQTLAVDAAITMDADLQDPPEIIPQLVGAWRDGADVVRAVRRTRAERGLRGVGFAVFHRLYGRLTDYPIEPNSGTFGLLGRDALDAFNQLPERRRFFPGLRAWIGFRTAAVLYDRQARAAGEPQQTFFRLVRYALDGLLSFSYLPLRLLTFAGLGVSFLGFALGLYFIVKRLLGIETASTGFTTLVTLVLFLGGVQLIGIGVLGEYLGRIYDEVKQRPRYFLKNRRGSPRADDR
ncbi:glycosyltransferase family 2 protein [Horticoccus luteus]|uniref:Glycosyltransferase family 2 protein n=1 Tax=Horticoccus luteus TaxID=2862869 RepID=A0A8F9TVS6_9BACT|nr:glycosyltransferase family 2 protein [Horticoccus luteus]QYM78679.1 glycosyltransferase family 2 protein [Horticoccus luteus]